MTNVHISSKFRNWMIRNEYATTDSIITLCSNERNLIGHMIYFLCQKLNIEWYDLIEKYNNTIEFDEEITLFDFLHKKIEELKPETVREYIDDEILTPIQDLISEFVTFQNNNEIQNILTSIIFNNTIPLEPNLLIYTQFIIWLNENYII